MADAAAAMALALVDGRAILTVAARDLGPVLVERLEVEWPGTRRALAVDELRNRRGRLRAATLVIDRARLESQVAGAQLPAGRLGVMLEPDRLVLSGGQSNGAAAFWARLSLGAGTGRKLQVTIDGGEAPAADLRTALAAMFGAPATGEATLEINPLSTALDEIFVADGFRLPDSGDLRLGVVRVSAGRIAMRWSSAGRPETGELPTDDTDEVAALRRALDTALPGPARAEVAHLLAAAYEKTGEEEGALAALRICIDNAAAGPLVGAAWRRLVEIFARRGDPHAAARALIASADDPRVGASEIERAGTLVAAAEILRKRLELPADAGMLLERAVTLDPASAEALEALEALSVDAGDFDRLAEVLERKVEVVARGPREQKTILARLAEIYDKSLARPPLARSTYERLLKIDPAHAAAREYLARNQPAEPARPPAPPARTGTLPPPPPSSPEAPAPGGDARTGEKYWRSAGVESEPVLRANALVAKARVSLSRGEIPAATDDLELALGAAPHHAGALVLLAEISYRKQDWHRARELYAALELVPDAAQAVPREQIVQRRAALAHRLGDTAEAEALYRELAILSTRHVEARRVLAELALARGDTATAALRLEELLRLLPLGSSADLGDLRHRLGAIYAETGEWNGARYYLELVVDQEPGRLPALELLLQTYQKLGLHQEAAEACGRLARLYPDRAHRAAVLYRQGEIPPDPTRRRARRARRLPPVVGRRSRLRPLAAAPGRSFLGRRGSRCGRRSGRRPGLRAAFG